MGKNYIKRMLLMISGILCLSFSISIFRLVHLGADPFSTMNLGVSSFFGFSFGGYQLIVNLVLLLISYVWARRYIGVGTLVNLVCVGIFSDIFLFQLTHTLGEPAIPLVIRVAVACLTAILACFGCALYMVANIGIAPYDILAYIIVAKTKGKCPFQWARILTDSLSVLIGFTFGYTIGIATLITMFFTGPLIQLFVNKLKGKGGTVPQHVAALK